MQTNSFSTSKEFNNLENLKPGNTTRHKVPGYPKILKLYRVSKVIPPFLTAV